jgi:hypothetical protein
LFLFGSLPLRVTFEALPSETPPPTLHPNIIVIKEQLVLGEVVDIDNLFPHQHDVLKGGHLERQRIGVLEEYQRLVDGL